MAERIKSVQTYGRKKTATAVAHCKAGRGLIKVNGRPLEYMEPQILRLKLQVCFTVLYNRLSPFFNMSNCFSR